MKNLYASATTSLAIIISLAGVGQLASAQSGSQNNATATSTTPAKVVESAESDYQWGTWRGQNNNGIVDDQKPVTTWSKTDNVLWSSKIPGRGHSTPIIVNDRIFLTTSNVGEKTQSVLCYDRKDGTLLWNTLVNKGNFSKKIHLKNTHASPSVACDGQRVYALFNNNGKNQLTALDVDGEIQWQRHIADYKTFYKFGSGSSPILYKGLLYVPNEAIDDCAIIVINPADGSEVRRIERGNFSSYSTPVIANVAGREQLLISGGKKVCGYDPESGEELWKVDAKWDVSCNTMVWDDEMVFASGGYPAQQTLGINAKTGEKIWDHPVKCYEQSMLVHEGRLYGLSDRGIVYCWEAKTGKELFKQRFESPVNTSPLLVDGNIFFTSEKGTTLIIKAGTDDFIEVARNKLGDLAFASLAITDNKIYARVGVGPPKQVQEFLYCIGE